MEDKEQSAQDQSDIQKENVEAGQENKDTEQENEGKVGEQPHA